MKILMAKFGSHTYTLKIFGHLDTQEILLQNNQFHKLSSFEVLALVNPNPYKMIINSC